MIESHLLFRRLIWIRLVLVLICFNFYIWLSFLLFGCLHRCFFLLLVFNIFILECCFLNSSWIHVLIVACSDSELLSFVINTHALGVLVKTRKTSALIIWPYALHFSDLCPSEDVGELDGVSCLLLVPNDLGNSLFDWVSLVDSFVEFIALVCVLVSTWKHKQ